MTTWKKLINSGSNAHVASLNISDTPSDVSSSIIDGSVFFSALPEQPIPNTLIVGTLMKSVSPAINGGLSRYVMISNDFTPELADYNIPWNTAQMDLNNDGTITTADLLLFLTIFGTTCTPNSGADTNGDGLTGSGDLLEFLILFGSFSLVGLDDTRPEIIWGDYDWIADNGNITETSVQNYYNLIGETAFWEEFGVNYTNPDTNEGYTVLEYIENSNPPSGILLIDIFKYIYFTQTSSGIYGGHDFYNRNGEQDGQINYNNPIGYPV